MLREGSGTVGSLGGRCIWECMVLGTPGGLFSFWTHLLILACQSRGLWIQHREAWSGLCLTWMMMVMTMMILVTVKVLSVTHGLLCARSKFKLIYLSLTTSLQDRHCSDFTDEKLMLREVE